MLKLIIEWSDNMLKIQNNSFEIKYTEINIRQRMFEKQSYVTMIINTEFFPSLVGENIISGSIEIKLDLKEILSEFRYNHSIGVMEKSIVFMIFLLFLINLLFRKKMNLLKEYREELLIYQLMHSIHPAIF